ncbi:MAG: glycosyltransferase [Actinomycetota bacterium]
MERGDVDVARGHGHHTVKGALSYILPVRSRPGDAGTEELTGYLAWLSERVELVIVDGSDKAAFRAHRALWDPFSTHVPPADDIRCANGKVRGVLTGLRLATRELVVIADDDVRYDDDGLRRMARLLADADLVRPQNYFDPLPWHARWDTARILMNRAVGSDFPGTLGVRRSFLTSVGGYDGDVLFENLELLRTVTAAGGRVVDEPTLFVRRRPPTFARFLEQRPRQAYDDWAQPLRFAAFLATAPALLAIARRRPRGLVLAAGATILAAGIGRARNGGRQVFDRASPLFAPLWVGERAALVWVALARRLFGRGCPYAGTVIGRAANPPHVLRRRLRAPLSD